MRTYHDPRNPPPDVDAYFVKRALVENKALLKIVWDEASGYPEHAWGYVQWSVRPYVQWYGCDGTTDSNIHLIAYRLCTQLGLDYAALYEQAYNRPCDAPPGKSWLRLMGEENWAAIEAETVMPELSKLALCGVLDDLHEVNNHSFAYVLEKEFIRLGYDVEDYWLCKPKGPLKAPAFEQLSFVKERES